MPRDLQFNFRVSDQEHESLEASCSRTGVTMTDAVRALITAMSGGELVVIATDTGPQVAAGEHWVRVVKRMEEP